MLLPILHDDSELVVVNKPSGLLVHRSSIDRQTSEAALQIVRDQVGQHVYPVHRLDRATSGALIFAKTSEAARHLAEQFAAQTVSKIYLAIVRGAPAQTTTLDYPLREELDRKSDKRARLNKPAQPAVTDFTSIATCELNVCVDKYPVAWYSLVRAIPRTGRKHQIRRHLRHLGHPIIGDITYGSGKHNQFFERQYEIRRLLLACVELRLQHPGTQQALTIKAPLCEDFKKLATQLGWSSHLEG